MGIGVLDQRPGRGGRAGRSGNGGTGGIATSGTLTLTDSTVSANTGGHGGAGAGGGGGGQSGFAFDFESTMGNGGDGGNGGRGGDAGVGGVTGPATLGYSTMAYNTGGTGGSGGDGGDGGDLGCCPGPFDGNPSAGNGGDGGLGGAGGTGGFGFGNPSVDGVDASAGPDGGVDCRGSSLTSSGYNLISVGNGCTFVGGPDATDQVGTLVFPVDPLVAALADNGGSTQTHALKGASPAVDAIPIGDASCTGTDQRGVTRPQGDGCDIGAFERDFVPPDTTAPDTTIDASPSDPSSGAVAVFDFSSSEPGSTFECKLDGGTFAFCGAGGKAYSGLADGSHTFQVRATDAASNTDLTPATFTWVIDTTAPTTTIDSGPSGTVAATTADFTFSADEAPVTFRCSLDGGAYAACSSPSSNLGLADGVHTFRVRATDAAGNTGDAALQVWTVSQDGPPDVAIHRPDELIGLGGSFVGDGIYNANGFAQTKGASRHQRKSIWFTVRIQNDGTDTDGYTLLGYPLAAPGFTVAYSTSGTDITTAVQAGTYEVMLAPAAEVSVTIKIHITSSAVAGSRQKVLLSATSTHDATKVDAVKAKVKALG